ncbi:MAG: hypothetical protein ACRES3_10470 [Steroidobacteraceae bacterium]
MKRMLHMALIAATMPMAVRAEGHGPAFGLATPTLARGQWSSDTAAMRIENEMGATTQFRQLLSYGVTEDLQVNLAFPLGQGGGDAMLPVLRGASMMGATETVEASVQWRFNRTAPAIGMRRESALFVGVSEPTDEAFGDVEAGTGFNLAAVTGYASRTTYWWVGGGVQGNSLRDGVKLGNVYYASAVFGWRPPLFRQDYPKPDWRLFIESVYEKAERHKVGGEAMRDSGGERLLAGPSVLGLYGHWGIEGGIIWPVSQSLNGTQPQEHYRAKLVFTYWY